MGGVVRWLGLDGVRGRAGTLAERAIGQYFSDGCPQLAAAIAYRTLLSLFPAVIVATAVATLLLDNREVADLISDQITDLVTLSPAGEAALDSQLRQAAGAAGTAGVVGLVILLWAASGLIGALRFAVDRVWGVEGRQFARGKLLDLMLAALLGVVAIGSVALTLLVRLISDAGPIAGGLAGLLAPILVSFLGLLALFKILPSVRTYVRDLWPAALVGALLLELAKVILAIYFDRYFDNAIYGSLGAVVSLLIFVYVAAMIVLIAAELAAELPRVRAGVYDRAGGGGGAGGLPGWIAGQARQAIRRGKPEDPFRSEGSEATDAAGDAAGAGERG
jgi:membrane protein